MRWEPTLKSMEGKGKFFGVLSAGPHLANNTVLGFLVSPMINEEENK
jgi:hypothetical protein